MLFRSSYLSGLKPFYPLVIFPVLKDGVIMLYSCAKALLIIRMGCVTLKDGIIVLYAYTKAL